MYEEWFQSMIDDDDMPSAAEITAMKSFIDGKISASEAARKCTFRIAAEHSPNPELLWSLCESMAIELPGTQNEVVELLAAIKQIPDPVRNGQPYKINGEKVFSQLGYFGAGFADGWSGKLFLGRGLALILIVTPGLRDLTRAPDQPLGLEKWASVNAFAARLTTRFVIDWRLRNVETIDDALDERYLKEPRTRNFFLPAAANQIIYGALPLWNLGNDPGPEPRLRPYRDWVAWKSKLEELAESDDLAEDLKALLQRAVEVMAAIAQGPQSSSWVV